VATIAITGSSSGIGAATRERLVRGGHRVLGIDLRNADVEADLADERGRLQAAAGVRDACGGQLGGLVVCAGVGPQFEPKASIVSINYFGAQRLLAELREVLAAGGGAAVAVASNSATIPGMETPLVEHCLTGDEAAARALAAELMGQLVYAGSKLALARWVRRNAPRPEWAGAGVRLNAVAPGAVLTPLLQAGLDDPVLGQAIRDFPIPTGGFGKPEQIAAAIELLLGPAAEFCCGSVLFVDGGTDAMLRPDTF